ncbi:MAG TPA: GMC family oxidoreductase [Acidimicrobiales bacterium]|nr:GMC family oxidoreductase [Acidimicrobiales bacterium]
MAGKGKAIIIGSGPGGSTAAMTLAEAGWNVVIFEKGPNYFGDLKTQAPATPFSNDELKGPTRFFEDPDTDELEPRTYRPDNTTDSIFTGFVNNIPTTVGGGAVHFDAKTPRYWDIDFRKKSMLGPIDGADIIDWPFDYAELAPYYDEIEHLIGVAGDIHLIAESPTRAHAPRVNQLPMPPGPPQLSSILLSGGATSLGLHPFPAPMAINSVPYDGRPACNNCGFCSTYGCPIHARIGALAPLRRALIAGAELRPESFVSRINRNGTKATGVTWIDNKLKSHDEAADLVVVAANAIESARLVKLSELPDPHGVVGKYLMFHWFTAGVGVFLTERIHAYRGRSTTHVIDDFADPDFPGARAAAAAAGLPYFRGGTCELGGSQDPISEGKTYQFLLTTALGGIKPFGTAFKELMRASVLRDRLCGIQMLAEDLPQRTNTVDLDPKVKDYRGFPVARITYSPHAHELAAQRFYIPLLTALLKAAGADAAAAVPQTSSAMMPVAQGNLPTGAHIMGGLRMSADPALGATDGFGRLHTMDNVVVADGGVFPSAGGHNVTLTIMATALRNSRQWASVFAARTTAPAPTRAGELPPTGGPSAAAGLAAGAAAAAVAAAARSATRRPG